MTKFFDTDQEAEEAKQKLEEEMFTCDETETKEYLSSKVNWVSDLDTWIDVKTRNNDLVQQNENRRLFFLSHTKDVIEGKAQLVHQTIQRISLMKRVVKIDRNDGSIMNMLKFIDDKFDKRYDGNEVDSLSLDFWVYRVVDEGKEYYLFSEKELSKEYSKFNGMKINIDDVSDISNTLKVKKITSIFICMDSEPNVKIIPKEAIPNYAKECGWDVETFMNYFFSHNSGKIFRYGEDFDLLRVVQMLSGRYEGYPLHLFKMGPVGTGKTTEAEVLDERFCEDQGILEASNSTLKSLVPSFKEKPANLGYIAKCHRIAIIDEMMKMVEQAMSKAHDNIRVGNYFGQMNMLLEQKERMVGSGNDNSTKVKSSSKVCVTTNNITGKSTISAHIGLVDATTLSRFLVWVQDLEETNNIYNRKNVVKYRTHRGKGGVGGGRGNLYVCDNDLCVINGENDWFLTIFDSCQEFLVNYDEEKCEKVYNLITNLIQEPMKQVWRSRGLHHTILILDGIVKFRCIFKDYDSKYEVKEEDYLTLERLLKHMAESWKTNLTSADWKENF